MAVQQIPRTLEGKQFILFFGRDENNKTVLHFDAVEKEPLTGNTIRYEPDELRIPFGEKGNTAYIRTIWRKVLVGPNGGKVNQGTITPKPGMTTNKTDETDFINSLGNTILISMANGLVRAILGFNNMPIFYTAPVLDGQGNVIHKPGDLIIYTPEQEAEAPTNDYDPPVNPI